MPNSVRVTIFIMLAHLSLGAVMPYLPVWLEETKGLSGSQIGVVLASASFGRIIIGPLAAAWAEGRSDRRTPLIVFALGLFFGYATFPFLGAFWPIALSCFATGVMFQCLMAFTEAATLRATEGSKHWPYGRARAAASTAFVIASLGAGWVIQEFGVPAVYIWFLSACALSAYWAFQMQPDPVAERSTKRLTERLIGGFGLFSRPTFLLGVMGASLIQAAHAFYYGFSSTLWLKQGYSGGQIGMLWAVGVVAEVAFLALAANRLGRFRPELLILVGGLGAMIRWSVLAFSPGFWVASAVQLLHAGTFAATHIGFMRLLEVEVHPDQRPTGQQLASSILMSPVMGLASIGAGWLYDHFGVGGYWSGVVLAACGIACVSFVLLRTRVRLKPL